LLYHALLPGHLSNYLAKALRTHIDALRTAGPVRAQDACGKNMPRRRSALTFIWRALSFKSELAKRVATMPGKPLREVAAAVYAATLRPLHQDRERRMAALALRASACPDRKRAAKVLRIEGGAPRLARACWRLHAALDPVSGSMSVALESEKQKSRSRARPLVHPGVEHHQARELGQRTSDGQSA
jgi:hypothetical protein